MAFTRQTNSIALFASSGDYHAEAKLSYTKNESNRTFTVTVEGVRAYCKYGWNFRSNITIWLGTSSNGNGMVQQTGTISSSGSNTYKGWLPKSGYANIKVSKTFNYNDDGSVPTVHFYLNAYNASVKWLNAGKSTPVNVTYSGNIKSEIATIGPKDISPPTVTSSHNGANASAIYWTAKSNVNCSEWQYRVDGGSWKVFGSAGKSTSGSVSVKPGSHYVEVCGKKASNGKWGYASTLWYDTSLPTISSQSITVSASNKGVLNFRSNYKCDYKLTASGYDTGWISNLAANVNPARAISLVNSSSLTYTLTVRRSDNTSLTNSVTISVDSRLPNVTGLDFIPNSKTSGTLYVNSGYSYQYRYKTSSVWSGWSGTVSASSRSAISVTLPENKQTTVYLQVRRSSNTNLYVDSNYVCDLRIPDIKNRTLTVTANGKATLKFSSSYSFNYRYYNGTWSSWSGNYNANTSISKDITVPSNKNTNVKVQVRRTFSSYLDNSIELPADSRLPDITNAVIAVDSYTSGRLNYKSTFNTNYEITTTQKYTGTLSKNTVLDKKLVILKDKLLTYTLTVRRSDNTSLYSTVQVSTDTCVPILVDNTITITDFTKGTLVVKPKFASVFVIANKTYNCGAGNVLSVPITLNRDSNTNFSFTVKRQSNLNLTYAATTKYDTVIPKFNISVDPTSSKQTTVFISNCTHNYKLSAVGGGSSFDWKSHTKGNKTITNLPIVDDYCGDYIVKVTRSDTPCLYNTKTIKIDSVLPRVTDLVGYPVKSDGTVAKIAGIFNLPVKYYIANQNGIINIKENNEDTAVASNNITVTSDNYNKYTLVLERTSNSKLRTTYNNVVIDTRLPKIKLVNYDSLNEVLVAGSTATVKYQNDSKDTLPLHSVTVNYIHQYTNDKVQMSVPNVNDKIVQIATVPKDFNTEEIQLIPGQDYKINVTAHRTIKNYVGNFDLVYTSNSFYFTAKGGIWIVDGNKYKSGTIYLYNAKTGKWKECIPYTYDNARWVRNK